MLESSSGSLPQDEDLCVKRRSDTDELTEPGVNLNTKKKPGCVCLTRGSSLWRGAQWRRRRRNGSLY